MCERAEDFAARGAALVAVGGAADYQAAALQPSVAARLLLDPDGALRSALGIDEKLGRREMLSLGSGRRYLSSLLRTRPGSISRRHVEDRPALVVLADLELVWGYEGRRLGDYPPVDEVLGVL